MTDEAWVAQQVLRMHDAEQTPPPYRFDGWGCAHCTPTTRQSCRMRTWALAELAAEVDAGVDHGG
jgi:hypothetical protein